MESVPKRETVLPKLFPATLSTQLQRRLRCHTYTQQCLQDDPRPVMFVLQCSCKSHLVHAHTMCCTSNLHVIYPPLKPQYQYLVMNPIHEPQGCRKRSLVDGNGILYLNVSICHAISINTAFAGPFFDAIKNLCQNFR